MNCPCPGQVCAHFGVVAEVMEVIPEILWKEKIQFGGRRSTSYTSTPGADQHEQKPKRPKRILPLIAPYLRYLLAGMNHIETKGLYRRFVLRIMIQLEPHIERRKNMHFDLGMFGSLSTIVLRLELRVRHFCRRSCV